MPMVITKRRFGLVAGACLMASAILGVMSASQTPVVASVPYGIVLKNLEREIPQYPGATFWPMGKRVYTEGQAREMAHAQTPDGYQQVIDRYDGIFHSQGLTVNRHEMDANQEGGLREGWLVASGAKDPWLRTVVVSEGTTQTTIVASVTEKFAQAEKPMVAVPKECVLENSHGANDDYRLTEVQTLLCDAPRPQILAYYAGLMAGSERTNLGDNHPGASSIHLRFADSTRELLLTIAEHKKDDGKDVQSKRPKHVVQLIWHQRIAGSAP